LIASAARFSRIANIVILNARRNDATSQ